MADNYCKCCGDGTPEYIIELNQQGAPGKRGEKGDEGYSPVIDFIADNDEIRFSSTNENNITSTPNLYDFVAKKDLSNVNNLYDLVAKRDLSNLPNPVTINDITINNYNSGQVRLDSNKAIIFENKVIGLGINGTYLIVNRDLNNIYLNTANRGKATYNGNELATVNNISDSKITISQGNVVKGSFTLNQYGDTTIELDSGGGVTNPLKIEGATEDNPSGGTVTYSMELGLDSSNKVYLSQTTKFNQPDGVSEISEYIIKDNIVAGIPEIRNSITELTTLADNTEASLNELKTDYESNKTEVAGELTNLGNQLNTKVSKTELDELANTKNDNIFDIGKFTVIGSPTITDDGVLTTSNSGNCIKISLQPLGDNWDIVFPYNKPQAIDWHTVDTIFRNNGNWDAFSIGSYGSQYYLWLKDINNTNLSTAFVTTSYGSFGDYLIKLSCRILNGIYTLNIYSSLDDGINWNLEKTITSSVAFYPCNNAMADIRINTLSTDTNASIDLKNFSITVDGKEVSNGLMSSTKPIYDKITTTNTTLSTFQTDTTNNFSAVNSALNEKANLSDLANYVPLATYNALLARVEALEAEINGGNA